MALWENMWSLHKKFMGEPSVTDSQSIENPHISPVIGSDNRPRVNMRLNGLKFSICGNGAPNTLEPSIDESLGEALGVKMRDRVKSNLRVGSSSFSCPVCLLIPPDTYVTRRPTEGDPFPPVKKAT